MSIKLKPVTSVAALVVCQLVACGSSHSSPSSAGASSGAAGTSNGTAGMSDSAAGTSSSTAGSSGTSANGGSVSDAGSAGSNTANAGNGGQAGAPVAPDPCAAALAAPTPNAAAPGPVLQVDVCANRHAISNDIYGVTLWYAEGDTKAPNIQFAHDIALPLNRLGGDATTRYNWQVDASNAGFDWFFMGGGDVTTPVPGASFDARIATDKDIGARTVITIPIIEYINKTAGWQCSYPKSVYPNQQMYNMYVHPNGDDCGNGKDTTGKVIPDAHVTTHDILNSPDIQKAWVLHLVSKFGTAAKGGVPIYQMDNEPTGWPGIHFDVRPLSPTCDELRDKTYAYAAAVKAADPSAAVLGPGDIPVADDFDCTGSTRGQYYLAAMADYEKQHGVRLLDYYSHHYPGCCSGDPIDNAEKRIAKHKGWIADKYPGTKLGYDEYNWGTDVNTYATALLAADGLGLFGRDAVDMASFWGLDDTRSATGTAFRLYRDYDGKGAAFGDVSTAASSADATKLHVYAAQRSQDKAITVVVVNKTNADITSALALSNHQPKGDLQVFLFSSAAPTGVVAKPSIPVTAVDRIVITYPAASATLLVVP
jgi:hypothetical protein